MKYQNLITIIDFELNIKTRFEISENSKYLKENDENERIYYEKEEIRYS